MRTLKLGMLGCGTVGSDVLKLLRKREDRFAAIDTRLQLAGVLVRDPRRARDVPPGTPLTSDPAFLQECDVVVEVMGGVDRPLALLLPVLQAGKPVVTANKAMLAERWDALRAFAEQGLIHFEASVMAGIPVLTPLATILRGSRVERLQAILNGTCNYILTRMEEGESYDDALRDAQQLGYAEDPPTLDVGGWDAAHKLTVLARLVANPAFRFEDVSVRGIDTVTQADVQAACATGERVKLIGELTWEQGVWRASVAPRRLPATHPLCTIRASHNALWLDGEGCGELFFSGGGAGGLITASAVVGDIFDAITGVPGQRPLPDSTAAWV